MRTDGLPERFGNKITFKLSSVKLAAVCVACCLALAIMTLDSRSVQAAEATQDTAALAKQLQMDGTRLQLQGNVAKAIEKYKESLALQPNQRLQGLVEQLEKNAGKEGTKNEAAPAPQNDEQKTAVQPPPPEQPVEEKTPPPADTRNIRSKGQGATVEEAVRNAATNALTAMVSDSVPVETLWSKQPVLEKGIQRYCSQLSLDTKKYEQGPIRTIEPTEESVENGTYRVFAKIEVHNPSFKVFLKEMLGTEAGVD